MCRGGGWGRDVNGASADSHGSCVLPTLQRRTGETRPLTPKALSREETFAWEAKEDGQEDEVKKESMARGKKRKKSAVDGKFGIR